MLNLSRRILISAPKESVRLYLQDLKKMAEYEPKVDRIEASYPQAESGFVEASGRFLGLPWRGAFKVEFTADGGCKSEMVRGPLARMVWVFNLRPVSGGTVLTHEEHYLFPLPLRPLAYLLRGRIARRMDLELGAIKEGAERLHRRIQLREIEASR